MELKRILRQYAFTLVVIMCIGLLLSGFATVRDKTRYNMDMTPYETVEITDIGKKISEFVKNFLTDSLNSANIV